MLLFACPICKRLSFHRALCLSCAGRLFERREAVWREARDSCAVNSLFRWERDGWLGLRWWVAALKGKEHPAFWREPADWALDTFAVPPQALLVPLPSRRGAGHALGYARALAARTGWLVEDVLRATDTGAQKRRDRTERRRRQLELTRPLCNKSTPVILIDDIVTTGATVAAGFRALGRPRSCQAWCLVDRSLSSLAGG